MLGEFGETLVVDWGLAKIVQRGDQNEGEAPLRPSSGSAVAQTVAGRAIGTPAYMSPEQAEGRLEALGPATDVYSLGATLYCLLTGRAPVPNGDFADTLEKVRRGDIASAREVRGDVPKPLEAIRAKAMSVKPADRYATALSLAADVERWLGDEPVSAFRDPPLVRTARWARKHRTAVMTVGSGLLVTLVALSIGLFVVGGYNRKLKNANDNLTEALSKAEKERRIAVAVNEFLQDDLLGQADIGNQPFIGETSARNRNITVAELLDRAALAIEIRFHEQPETEASIRMTIGNAYRGSGRYEQAQQHLGKAKSLWEDTLGVNHPALPR
jgi:serine/threonine protein kinase